MWSEKEDTALALFLREKPAKLMLSLKAADKKPKYVNRISKEIDCTYSHIIRLLDKLQELDLVKFTKVKRVKYVELTETGKDLALDLESVVRRLSKIQEHAPERAPKTPAKAE
ncbi:MAG: winged helix DNA-binding protein [Candidatus Aenigmarchaeota archaeon]|nr:winged helix DNA-binding protein [Candidatus Aenigmarchaeota archaeon]